MEELARGTHQLIDRLDHVHRNTDGARLIGDRTRDRLTDPPRCVGAELVAAAVFELVDRLHQPDVAFLNKIKELQAAVRIFFSDGNYQAQIRLDHFLLGDPRLALALLHHVDDAPEFGEAHARLRGDVGDFRTDALDRIFFALGKGGPLLVLFGAQLDPRVVHLVTDIGGEEVDALDLVTLGKAQHLAAQRGEAAVEGVEVVDQELDLGRVELHALDLGGELFAQGLVLRFLRVREGVAQCQRVDAFALKLLEGVEQRGYAGKGFERFGLKLRFHLREGEGVVLLLFLFALGTAFAVLVFVSVGFGLVRDLVVLADRRAGGGFGDFVVVVILGAFGHLLGRGFLGEHRVKIEDLAQLHVAVVERFGPLDDRVEGDRAFAQPHDHHVAASFDALGDGDLALAAEQFHRAHFAQIHAYRIVGTFAGGELAVAGAGVLGGALFLVVFLVLVVGNDIFAFVVAIAVLAFGFGILVVLDDLHAHFGQGGLNVLDLIGAHFARRQRLIKLVIGDIAALLRLADQLLDRRIVKIDQRGVFLLGHISVRFHCPVPPMLFTQKRRGPPVNSMFARSGGIVTFADRRRLATPESLEAFFYCDELCTQTPLFGK